MISAREERFQVIQLNIRLSTVHTFATELCVDVLVQLGYACYYFLLLFTTRRVICPRKNRLGGSASARVHNSARTDYTLFRRGSKHSERVAGRPLEGITRMRWRAGVSLMVNK